MKLIRNSAFFLILISTIIFSIEAKGQAISVDDLFRSPDIYSYKFNPSSEYIAKHYIRGEDYYVIEILDLANNRVADAFRIKINDNKYANISDYYWVDIDTLYISYSLGKKQDKKIFLDLDFDIFQKTKDEIATIRKIESKAHIIDPLTYQDNSILVQRTIEDEVEVYTTTTEAFQSDTFNKSDKFNKTLDSSLGYISGTNGQIQFAFKIKDEKLKYYYLKDYQSDWVELFEFGEFDFDFIPLAVLDKNKMVVITNRDTDKKSLVEFDYSTKTFGKILYQHDKYDLINASVSKETGEVSSVTYFENGHYKSEYFSKYDKYLDKIVNSKLPGKQYFTYSKHGNATKIILFVFSSTDPGSYYWLNTDTDELILLGTSHSFLNKYRFSETETFSVKSKNDIEIEAILTKPKKSNGVLLVEPHGGPVGIRNLDIYSRSNQFYASRGFTVLNVNFRGSSGYGKKFLSEGQGQFGKQIEQDIFLLVNEVKEKYDFKFTCSMGASYGGYSAMILATYAPDDYDCVIGRYGVYDLPLLFNTSNYRMGEENIKSISKVVGEYDDSLKEFSPVYLAENIKSPILLIAGKEDFIAAIEQTNRMKYRLKQLGKDVEAVFYEDTGHGHDSYYWESHEHLLIVDFINRKLKLNNKSVVDSELIGQEAIILADSFEFEDKIENSSEKAFFYYKVAAENKHPRGLYNLASFYHRGKFVEQDINKAIELYDQASTVGNKDASFRLGKLYQKGSVIDKNLDKAYQYFRSAEKQGHEEVQYELMQSTCMGWGIVRDMTVCFDYIKSKLNDSQESIFSIIKELIDDSTLNKANFKELVSILQEFGFHDIANDEQLKIEDFGLFVPNYRHLFELKHEETSQVLSVKLKDRVGIEFEIIAKNKNYKDRAIFKAIWRHPLIKVDTLEKGSTETSYLKWTSYNKNDYVVLRFDNILKRVSGNWSLELQSLEGNTLFYKDFQLTFE